MSEEMRLVDGAKRWTLVGLALVGLAVASGACGSTRPPDAPKAARATASMDASGVIYLSIAFDGRGTVDYVHAADVKGARVLSQTLGPPIALQLARKQSTVELMVTSRGDKGGAVTTFVELSPPASGPANDIPVRMHEGS